MRRSHRHHNRPRFIHRRPPTSNLNSGAWALGGAPAAPTPDAAEPTLAEQLVVIYGRGPATAVYAAAYSAQQAEAALWRCIAQHGRRVSARIVPARSSLPAAL
jgi:hypothetical protein